MLSGRILKNGGIMNAGLEVLTTAEWALIWVFLATLIISYTLKIIHLGSKIRKTLKETAIVEDRLRKLTGH